MRHRPHRAARPVHRRHRAHRRGQDDAAAGVARSAPARRPANPLERRARRRPGDVLRAAAERLHAPGAAPLQRDAAREHPARPRRRRPSICAAPCGQRCWTTMSPDARARPRYPVGSARGPAVGRPGPARGGGPHVPPQRRVARLRRSLVGARCRHRADALGAALRGAWRGHLPGGVAPSRPRCVVPIGSCCSRRGEWSDRALSRNCSR